MGQDISAMLTGLSTSLNQYMGLAVTNAQEKKKEDYKAQLGLQTDLAKYDAQELYKLAHAGKVSMEAAAAQYPEAAKMVQEFQKTNSRLPTVEEFAKLDDAYKKKNDQNLRQSELHDQRINSFIQKHSDALAKAGIPEMLNSYNELADKFTSGKDVKGIGAVDSHIPNVFLGEEGNRNRTNLQQLANTILKQRSGAAVSDQEYKRFLLELQAGKVPTEKAIKTHLGKIGDDLKSLVGLREAGIPKEALSEYSSRSGAILSSDVKTFGATKKPASSGEWGIKLKS